MIGCRSRGFSFTRALLGLAANELHLCGDAAAVPLVQEILKVTGDTIKVLSFSSLVFNLKKILMWNLAISILLSRIICYPLILGSF